MGDCIHQRIYDRSYRKKRSKDQAANLADWKRPSVFYVALLERIPNGLDGVNPVYGDPRYDAKNDAEASYVELLPLLLKECWIQFLKPLSEHNECAHVKDKK